MKKTVATQGAVVFSIEKVKENDALSKSFPINLNIDDGDADNFTVELSVEEAKALVDAFASAISETESAT